MAKQDLIPQLAIVFRTYGYEGATVARFSETTGLSKASLYYHFPNGKEEMAKEVLDYLNQRLLSALAELHQKGAPLERLRRLCERLNDFYHQGQFACLLALFSLGEASTLFQGQIQTALKTWIDAIAQVLTESEFSDEEAHSRAQQAVLQIQGALVLARGLSDARIFEQVLNELPKALLRR